MPSMVRAETDAEHGARTQIWQILTATTAPRKRQAQYAGEFDGVYKAEHYSMDPRIWKR